MWPLTAGGRYRQVAASTGLTVHTYHNVKYYYEFEMPNGERMTDSEWRNQDPPPSPEWTRPFRVEE